MLLPAADTSAHWPVVFPATPPESCTALKLKQHPWCCHMNAKHLPAAAARCRVPCGLPKTSQLMGISFVI